MEPINNILNNHAMAPAQPAAPATPDPLSPADDEFPDPFANAPEESEELQEQATEPADGLPTPELDSTSEEAASAETSEEEPEQAPEAELEQEEPELASDDQQGEAPAPNSSQLQSLKRNIHAIQDQLSGMLRTIQMMQGMESAMESPAVAEPTSPNFATASPSEDMSEEGQVIEGVFDGMQMVGPDGKTYSVPPNYASKSKLVEGDHMKLTITPSGKFLYKQIGPIERKRIVGELVQGSTDEQWSVMAEGRPYHILKASVTFHSARPGDEVVILVPKDGESSWGAVENVMHK